jgi:hypothetical protein
VPFEELGSILFDHCLMLRFVLFFIIFLMLRFDLLNLSLSNVALCSIEFNSGFRGVVA